MTFNSHYIPTVNHHVSISGHLGLDNNNDYDQNYMTKHVCIRSSSRLTGGAWKWWRVAMLFPGLCVPIS